METIDKNISLELVSLKKDLKEKEELIQLLRDSLLFKTQKIEKLEKVNE